MPRLLLLFCDVPVPRTAPRTRPPRARASSTRSPSRARARPLGERGAPAKGEKSVARAASSARRPNRRVFPAARAPRDRHALAVDAEDRREVCGSLEAIAGARRRPERGRRMRRASSIAPRASGGAPRRATRTSGSPRRCCRSPRRRRRRRPCDTRPSAARVAEALNSSDAAAPPGVDSRRRPDSRELHAARRSAPRRRRSAHPRRRPALPHATPRLYAKVIVRERRVAPPPSMDARHQSRPPRAGSASHSQARVPPPKLCPRSDEGDLAEVVS